MGADVQAHGTELVAVVKGDCPTCQMVAPVLRQLVDRGGLTVHSQDDPGFPAGIEVHDDRALLVSHRLRVDTVPTLLRVRDDEVLDRAVGWDRAAWERLAGLAPLGPDLPPHRPGCGAANVAPGVPERLALETGELTLASRRVEVDELEDPHEVAHDRGWTDGLPVVPPTPLRVARMLTGTTRRPDEVVGSIPPNLVPCTVEKVAVNAVMAGCRPEHLPVVLAAIRAALQPGFAMHGLLCTLNFAGPVVLVNGPVARRVGMNWAGNALGQGNRANASIGRALQLVIRNVGGGRPGEIDRAVLGNPGKYTFCFAEDETDPDWEPLSVARGHARGVSTVTLFHGEGVTGFSDRASRTGPELARSLALALWNVTHPRAAVGTSAGAMVVLSPDHHAIFAGEGWDRSRLEAELWEALRRPAHEVASGRDGVVMGVDPSLGDTLVDKFDRTNLLLVRAGGRGGLNSAVIGGWTGQRNAREVHAVTEEITP